MILLKHTILQKTRKRPLSPSIGLKRMLKSILLLQICSITVFLLPSCKKSQSQEDATAELAASFDGSPAKEDVIKANTAFMEGRYKDSLNLLHKVVGSEPLTERQKKAIAGIVGQLLKVVHENPQLSKDTQIHQMMQMLIVRTMGET